MTRRLVLSLAGGTLLLAMAACASALSLPVSGASAVELTVTQLCVEATMEGGNVMMYRLFGTFTPAPDATMTPARPPGDAEIGQIIFSNLADCATCHAVLDDSMLIGPSLRTVADRAGVRRQDMTAEEYLRGSIIRPGEVIVSIGKPGVMPTTYEQKLSASQIDDVVAYLLTLHDSGTASP